MKIFNIKTVTRYCFNYLVEKHAKSFKYPLLDLGGGKNPSYLKYLIAEKRFCVDVQGEISDNVYICDLDKDKLDTKQKFKTIIMYNFLEHVFNYEKVLNNAKKCLVSKGSIHVFVPFLIPFHPDPNDYFRYTEQGLKTILKNCGYGVSHIDIVGGYFKVLLQYLQFFPFLGGVFIVFYPVASFFDFLMEKIFKDKYLRKYVLGYYIIAQKK